MGEKGGCCFGCSRVFLSLLNILLLLGGLTVIGLTLWLRLDKTFEAEIRENILQENSGNQEMNQIKEQFRFALTICFWVLCGFGLAGAIIGFIGSCAGMCGSRCTAGVYLTFLIIMTILEIAVGIQNAVQKYVYVAAQMQSTNPRDMNTLRQRYNCCGANGLQLPQCVGSYQPTCSVAVWDRLDFTLMIAGIVAAGIIIFQIVTAIIAIALIASGGRSSSRPANG
ncbi:unnamed protein product [Toxocara canis]|uniref:Tetraspanin n=1 Tax=Toxocara canis TaxID=6265 RepID=A0A183V8X2_TOXCA|nr:unnamed protein product [Toxocara canis]